MPDHPHNPRRLGRIGIVALIAALIVVASGIAARVRTRHQLETVARENGLANVAIVRPERAGGGEGLMLPGTVQAFNSAPIYARTNGYVRRWLVDIGEQVRGGQVLAILDAPEVDQQLAQARANYQTALANQHLAKSTAVRWQALLAKDAVSRQEADEKNGDLAAKIAVANAELANVKRLQALYGFTRLTAPFAGTVTSRTTQIGALVTSGSAAASPLFTISDVHRMRIYVRVPQADSALIHDGLAATLAVPEYPARSFPVTVVRSSGAVDPQSGAMLVELAADNRDRALKPGAYAQVHFPGATARGLRLPSTAVILGDNGATVAVLGPDGRVRIKPVAIGRDNGKMVEIGAGLAPGERVIDSPPDDIQPGDRVTVTRTAAAPAPTR